MGRQTVDLTIALDLLNTLDRHNRDFENLCRKVIDASLYWTGADETKNPALKTIRTLAGHYIDLHFRK